MRTNLLLLASLLSASIAGAQDQPARGGFYIDVGVEGTADAWKHADAVVYLRIEETKPGFGAPGLNVRQVATVISTLKTYPVGGSFDRVFTFLQAGSSDERPYAKGEQMIAFLTWSREAKMFVRPHGPNSVYVVKEDQVEWLDLDRDHPSRTERMKVEDFIAKLQALGK